MTFKTAVCILAASIFLGSLSCAAFAGELTVDDFSTSRTGNFPKKWRSWPTHHGAAEGVYSIAEENGAKFIKAYDDHDASEQIFLNFDWQIDKRPGLSWSWRATKLPEGARESDDSSNDSACGIYVVVGRYEGHAIKYVWSTSLPVGSEVTRRGGKLKIKVVDSGADSVNKWTSHTVNVAQDYEKLFGHKLKKNPSGIAILTDGNAVHKPAGCDYKNLRVGD